MNRVYGWTEKIIISVIAVALIWAGFLVQGAMRKSGEENARAYTTAVKTETDEQFNHAVDTLSGGILAEGDWTFKERVKFDEMNKEFTWVEREEEHYNMHTREVCSTDSDGNTKCHTETYWTWDHAKTEYKYPPTITFHGRDYDPELFNYKQFSERKNAEDVITDINWGNRSEGCYKFSAGKRWCYEVGRETFFASIFVTSTDDGLKGYDHRFLEGNLINLDRSTIDERVKNANAYLDRITVGFTVWVAIVLIAEVVALIVHRDIEGI